MIQEIINLFNQWLAGRLARLFAFCVIVRISGLAQSTPLNIEAPAMPCGLLCGVARDTDILSRGYQAYLDWSARLRPATFGLALRMALALAFSTSMCGLLFRGLAQRTPAAVLLPLQWLLCLITLLLVMEAPLHQFSLGRTAVAWTLALSFSALTVLPWRLSLLLAPKAGPRKVVALALYGGILLLLLLNLAIHP